MRPQIRSRGNLLGLVGLILLLATVGTAAARNVATNSLTISETLSEKVACTHDPASMGWSCGIVAGDNYTIAATVLLTGVNITTFTGATTFDLRVGNLQISHPLSADPKYTTGKASATFVSSYVNSHGMKVGSQTVILKWTTSELTVSINGKTTDTTVPGWVSIRANTYAGEASGPITDATTGSIGFGATSINFNPTPVIGSVVTKAVKGKDNTTYPVSTVKIKGTVLGVVAVPVPSGVQVTIGATTATTNLTVGSAGGTIGFSNGPLNGVTVSVPLGALPSNVQFTVSHNTATLGTNIAGTFSGHVIDLHVGGTPTNGTFVFNQTVAITIPFTNNGTAVPVPYYIDTNGSLRAAQVVSVDNQAGQLTFETFHASPYTWILAALTNLLSDLSLHNATTYFPWVDGFQVGNPGSVYNPGGECFGITAFEQWYFRELGGGFYPLYMQDIPLGAGGATIKGQEIIRTRAFDSVSRMWQSYVPLRVASFNLTPAQRYASICNILLNTKVPTILSTFGHSILVYDFYSSGATNGVLLVNDPNYPGTTQQIFYDPAFSNRFQYVSPDMTWSNLAMMGDGSFQMESFWAIYADAEDGFNGNGAAQVNVTSLTDGQGLVINSPTNGQQVSTRTVTLAGTIDFGQVVVSTLQINLNGASTVTTPVDPDTGEFSVVLSLNAGTNTLAFVTEGYNGANQLVYVLNSQLQPFTIVANLDQAAILVTLTWDTDDSDLDLYTIDPTYPTNPDGFSAYYHHTTTDGGNLDFDNTYGYGPEHWTLTYEDTIRWGSNYTVRVHYYSDHLACTPTDDYGCDDNNDPVPVRPTGWTVTVLLYEGTPQMVTTTYSGVLGDADGYFNDQPDGTGASWADVVTITPVQAGPEMRKASVKKTATGQIQITAPIPSAAERRRLKPTPKSQL